MLLNELQKKEENMEFQQLLLVNDHLKYQKQFSHNAVISLL